MVPVPWDPMGNINEGETPMQEITMDHWREVTDIPG